MKYLFPGLVAAIIFTLAISIKTSFWLSIPLGIILAWMALEDFLRQEVDLRLLIILGIILAVITYSDTSKVLLHLISAGIVFVLFFFLILIRRSSIGFGDVLIGGLLGVLVRPEDIPFALISATIPALVFWICLSLTRGIGSVRLNRKITQMRIPLVPFLNLGFLSVAFLESLLGSLSERWILS